MRKYRCVKSFVTDCYEADGFLIENSGKVIDEGELYTMDETGSTIIGGEVHLDNMMMVRGWR